MTGESFVDPRGSYRWPAIRRIDLSLNYAFHLWKTTLGARLEVFNVLNEQEQIAGVTLDGPGFGEARSVHDYQQPRDYRLSFTFSW